MFSFIRLNALLLCNVLGFGALYLPSQLYQYKLSALFGIVFSGLGALSWAMIVYRLFVSTPKDGEVTLDEYILRGLQVLVPRHADRGHFYTFVLYWIMSAASNAVFVICCFDQLQWSSEYLLVWYAVTFVIFGLLNCIPSNSIYVVEATAAFCKVLVLAIVPMIGYLYNTSYPTHSVTDYNAKDIGLAASYSIWSFFGIESAVLMGGVTPQLLYCAMISAVLMCIAVYCLGMYMILKLCTADELMGETMPYAILFYKLVPEELVQYTSTFTSWAILCIVLSSLYSWMMLNGEMAKRGAQSGIFPKAFMQRLNLLDWAATKTGGVYYGLICSAVVSMLTILVPCCVANQWSGTAVSSVATQVLNLVVDFGVLVVLILYSLSVVSYCVLHTMSCFDYCLVGMSVIYLGTAALSFPLTGTSALVVCIALCTAELLFVLKKYYSQWFVK